MNIKQCSIQECEKKEYVRKLCVMHYTRFIRGKNLLKPTKYDHRPAIMEDIVAKIPLGVNAKHGYAIVDKNYSHLDKYRWTKNAQGYAVTRKGNKLIRMHSLVMDGVKISEGLELDHINRNKLDNRKGNLRYVTRSDNAYNTGLRSDNKTGYKGVHWHKQNNNWNVRWMRKYYCATRTFEEAVNIRKDLESSKGVS